MERPETGNNPAGAQSRVGEAEANLSVGLGIDNVLNVLKAQTSKAIDPMSSFANAILDFYNLDYGWHRFQVHAHVFKGMDIAAYLKQHVDA